MRQLYLESGRWCFHVGKSFVRIEPPATFRDGRPFAVDISVLTGRKWTDIERGRWKRTTDGAVTPRDVRNYIETVLIPASRARS